MHERNGRQEAGLSQQPVKGKKNPCRAGAFFENQSAAGAVRELTQLGFFVLDVLANDERPLSELVAPLRRYAASGEINRRVEDIPALLAAIEADR